MSTPFFHDGALALDHWATIRARGEDAGKFLHQQLSQDMLGQPVNEARLAAYCSPKGRMLASFLVVRAGEGEWLLLCAADIAAANLKRLQMYVLRAKVVLEHAADLNLSGVTGAAARALWGPTAATPWEVRVQDGRTLVWLPEVTPPGQATVARVLALGAPPAVPAALGRDAWDALEVLSGVPHIEAVNVEQFVPQMVNFDVVGGVNFKKGCYPGQEVVARSHYLGALKRRMFLFEAPEAVAAGDEVFHAADPGQPCGRVVNAAAAGAGRWLALVEMKLSAADPAAATPRSPGAPAQVLLHARAVDGTGLSPLPLPYEVTAQDSRERQLTP